MTRETTFDDFEKAMMDRALPRKKDLERRFDELEVEYSEAPDREIARQFAMAALAASRRQTLDLLREYHAFAFEGEIPF